MAVAGVTAMETSVGGPALTFTVAEAILPEAVCVAVTMARPGGDGGHQPACR